MPEPDVSRQPAAERLEEPERSSGEGASTAEGGETAERRIAMLVMVTGLAFIAFFITAWIDAVLVLHEYGHWALKPGFKKLVFWQSWAAVLNAKYTYLIIGVVICLLAVHIVNKPNWNRFIPFISAFLGLVVIIMIAGFIGIVFMLDWGSFFKQDTYHLITVTILFVVEVAALVAIILVETPKWRKTIWARISPNKSNQEPTEEQEAEIPGQDEP